MRSVIASYIYDFVENRGVDVSQFGRGAYIYVNDDNNNKSMVRFTCGVIVIGVESSMME